jgi:hypothetical protein
VLLASLSSLVAQGGQRLGQGRPVGLASRLLLAEHPLGPPAFKAAICASSVCPSVEARA